MVQNGNNGQQETSKAARGCNRPRDGLHKAAMADCSQFPSFTIAGKSATLHYLVVVLTIGSTLVGRERNIRFVSCSQTVRVGGTRSAGVNLSPCEK